MPNKEEPIAPRGVFVDRTVGNHVEIVVNARGRRLAILIVDEAYYDERMPERWQRWLDRVDPQAQLRIAP